MEATSTSTPKNGRATRSSLACLPCRSRHLKCDGQKPSCARCTEVGKQCSYARSRRGGLDRAALTERRKRLGEAGGGDPPLVGNPSAQLPVPIKPVQDQQVDCCRSEPDLLDGIVIDDGAGVGEGTIDNDTLIDSYYKNFHTCHPFILPRKHLGRVYRDPGRQLSLTPLVAVMRFIGNIYHAREWSIPLKDRVEECFAQASPVDPIMVQCRLLYSIALFWYDHKADSKSEMEIATGLAVDLQMFRSEFAASHGAEDPVMRECWRRTWWMLYIVDAYYTGTLGTMNFRVFDIAATADLPCEELEYESGDIPPTPRTLQEFNCREFTPENVSFSSFAYLIGAVQCAAAAISATPKIAAKEDSTHVIQAADCSIDGWRLLLPKDRNQVMSETGEIDELMFQAHLIIHVSTIGLHRPLSALKFNAVEDVSSCAREPPLDNPTPDLVNVHTVRVLRSVEAQIRLLALPVRQFHHTPFATCMTTEGTLALLSACSTVLKDADLTVARDQIRMTVGCLKALGEVWPRTARNVREIQTIAQHVLGIGGRVADSNSNSDTTPGTSEVPSFGEAEGGFASSASGQLSDDNDMISSLGPIDDLCGWYNLGDLNDLPWGMSSGL
ncbi:hypothetical protein FE257_006069 [Aspergillus nanangensis]|uniref:Zn(2)-C6 fungal-type domain-containing protein n=1 Tax=Aspergillus nanangensis TaxID=2582783 RepID=A0AAD4CPQ8_ASPNN|nr:hypothetical protein FE257_006069 [Aspergillus nanangensis]